MRQRAGGGFFVHINERRAIGRTCRYVLENSIFRGGSPQAREKQVVI
jgi:hypothetical protein